MAINNDTLFNACLSGALAGMIAGRGIKSATATDYATEVNAAVAIATEVDSLIAEDGTITTGGGDASSLVITDSATTSACIHKPLMMHAIAKGALEGRGATSATAADYAVIAAAIKACYTQAIAQITNAA